MEQSNAPAKDDDFASLYEKSFTGMQETFRRGQLVETRVLSISKDTIFLELGGKSEGILARDELTGKDGQLTVKVGDPIKVYFLDANNGEKHFTTRISGDTAEPAMLEQAWQNKIPVEGLVEKEIKGGYEIKIGASRAFCPYSQMGPKRTDNPADYVGKHLTFKITEYKERGRNILVSNRVIHEEARQEKIEALKKTLQEGMVIKGMIKSIQDFGAFIDIDGVQALLPISEIGRSRVEDIHALLSVGQEIEASILKIDWKAERITLSMKSLLADPWEKAAEKYPEGSKHTGKVVRLTDFGAFVSLEPGLDGLVHISELGASSKFGNSKELSVKLGQTLSVQILGTDQANKRISLKPTTTLEEDETAAKYMDDSTDNDTYNPFAALLKRNR
jgi:small subunit ribosomal protein S1